MEIIFSGKYFILALPFLSSHSPVTALLFLFSSLLSIHFTLFNSFRICRSWLIYYMCVRRKDFNACVLRNLRTATDSVAIGLFVISCFSFLPSHDLSSLFTTLMQKKSVLTHNYYWNLFFCCYLHAEKIKFMFICEWIFLRINLSLIHLDFYNFCFAFLFIN